MKNIFKIVKRDFKNIKMNVVAIVVLLGLCLLPSLYAWFNISYIQRIRDILLAV